MIDLDKIKAAGLNSDRHSSRLRTEYEAMEAARLRADLWTHWCCENPHASAAEVAAFEASLATATAEHQNLRRYG